MTDRDRDLSLIARYVGGDLGAFDDIVRIHQDRVFSICMRMLRDREAAYDATQDTFLTLFRKADRYKAEAAFTTWLYRVTVNVCYDHLRRSQRKRTEQMPDHLDPEDTRAQDEYGSIEVRSAIEAALDDLPVEFRAAVVLVDIHGLALDTAGEALGVPVGTVKSRVFRGRRLLAEALGNLRPTNEHPRDE